MSILNKLQKKEEGTAHINLEHLYIFEYFKHISFSRRLCFYLNIMQRLGKEKNPPPLYLPIAYFE